MKDHYKVIRKRVVTKLSNKKITDQSYKKMCDINVIVKNYQKTGILSHQREMIARYIDNTKIPSLMEAQTLLRDAKESFLALPSDVRKLVDHDATKLVELLNDPEYEPILLKHGILEKKQVAPVAQQVSDPAKAEPALDKPQEE